MDGSDFMKQTNMLSDSVLSQVSSTVQLPMNLMLPSCCKFEVQPFAATSGSPGHGTVPFMRCEIAGNDAMYKLQLVALPAGSSVEIGEHILKTIHRQSSLDLEVIVARDLHFISRFCQGHPEFYGAQAIQMDDGRIRESLLDGTPQDLLSDKDAMLATTRAAQMDIHSFDWSGKMRPVESELGDVPPSGLSEVDGDTITGCLSLFPKAELLEFTPLRQMWLPVMSPEEAPGEFNARCK